jgi:predicted DNA-binding protein
MIAPGKPAPPGPRKAIKASGDIVAPDELSAELAALNSRLSPKKGRPVRMPEAGQRYALGLRVSAEIKQLLDDTARRTGSTQSQVAERLIDRALHYDQMLSAMNTTMDEIRRGNLEGAFRSEGYSSINSPYGKIWVPRDYPIERSNFIAGEKA